MNFLLQSSLFGIKNWIFAFFGLLLLLVFCKNVEKYSTYPFGNKIPQSAWGMGSYINIPTRFTRNQSYDLRGDPFPIPPNPYLSPWGISGYI